MFKNTKWVPSNISYKSFKTLNIPMQNSSLLWSQKLWWCKPLNLTWKFLKIVFCSVFWNHFVHLLHSLRGRLSGFGLPQTYREPEKYILWEECITNASLCSSLGTHNNILVGKISILPWRLPRTITRTRGIWNINKQKQTTRNGMY